MVSRKLLSEKQTRPQSLKSETLVLLGSTFLLFSRKETPFFCLSFCHKHSFSARILLASAAAFLRILQASKSITASMLFS
ncbi:hypothetical protein NC651_007322 [Populus alba x Populus x berolinensis]|nr:hypothetical protein NC651_007322 [Populus alba x Populus x berolinensis]